MIERIQYKIEKYLDGDQDTLTFSYELPDFIVDNYDTLCQEDADLAKRLDDTFPEICAEYERGTDDAVFRNTILKAYIAIYTRSMQLKDIPKEVAVDLIERTKELRPDMDIRIVMEDTALQQLGFADQAPCIVEVISTPWEIDRLVEEVDEMEVDAFIDEDAPNQKELERRWRRYSIIEYYLSGRYRDLENNG